MGSTLTPPVLQQDGAQLLTVVTYWQNALSCCPPLSILVPHSTTNKLSPNEPHRKITRPYILTWGSTSRGTHTNTASCLWDVSLQGTKLVKGELVKLHTFLKIKFIRVTLVP